MKLTARKRFSYNHRMLIPGEVFEPVHPIHATVLLAKKLARKQRDAGKVAAPPPELAKKVAEAKPLQPDDTAAARAEYQSKIGKRPFMGWDAAEIRRRMADAETPAMSVQDEASGE